MDDDLDGFEYFEPVYKQTDKGWFFCISTVIGIPIWCGRDMRGNGFKTKDKAIKAAMKWMEGNEN